MARIGRAERAEALVAGFQERLQEKHAGAVEVVVVRGRKTGAPVRLVVRYTRQRGAGVRGVAVTPVPD